MNPYRKGKYLMLDITSVDLKYSLNSINRIKKTEYIITPMISIQSLELMLMNSLNVKIVDIKGRNAVSHNKG